MKIIFFGTSNVALPVLEKLYQHHDIAAVVTTPDALAGREQTAQESPVSVLAGEMELPLLKPQDLKNDEEFILQLKKLQPDLSVVVSYGKIIPEDILSIPKFKTLNVHFSLLPKYRGAAPLQYALLNGDAQTGVSIFQLDEQLDHGPIVVQEKFGIEPDDNFITLGQRLAQASANIILKTIPDYTAGRLPAKPQNEAAATYAKSIGKQEGKVNWQKTAAEIYNQFRAFYPWPGIWTIWNGKTLKILDCEATELPASRRLDDGTNDASRGEPKGTTTRLDSAALISFESRRAEDYRSGTVLENGILACGRQTFLQIKTLQLEGKKPTDIKSFLNGHSNFVGGILS